MFDLLAELADLAVALHHLIAGVFLVLAKVLSEALDLRQQLGTFGLQSLAVLFRVDESARSVHHKLRHFVAFVS